MSNQPQQGTAYPADSHRGLRLVGLIAVAAGVLLLMAAAFVLSYPGIHGIARSAGIPPDSARFYPVMFDAMLVVACAAVLALRGAGLPSRCYAWLTMLLLLAAAAAADAVHATGIRLPHNPAAAAAAIIPWVLVLAGFGLLLAMLRHARLRRAMLAEAPERTFTQPSGHVEVQQRHGLDDLFGARTSPEVPAIRYLPPAKVLPAADGADNAPDLAMESDPGHDDPTSDEGHPSARAGQRQEQAAGNDGSVASAFSAAPTMDLADARLSSPGAARRSEARSESGAVPEPRRAASAAPETGPARETVPEPASDPGPARETRPAGAPRPAAGTKPRAAAKTQPTAAAKTQPAAKATAKPDEVKPAAGARPKATAKPKVNPAPEAGAAAGATAQPEAAPDAGAQAAAADDGAVWDPLRFERVRSSPVPPDG